jgi:hypothetical protein
MPSCLLYWWQETTQFVLCHAKSLKVRLVAILLGLKGPFAVLDTERHMVHGFFFHWTPLYENLHSVFSPWKVKSVAKRAKHERERERGGSETWRGWRLFQYLTRVTAAVSGRCTAWARDCRRGKPVSDLWDTPCHRVFLFLNAHHEAYLTAVSWHNLRIYPPRVLITQTTSGA